MRRCAEVIVVGELTVNHRHGTTSYNGKPVNLTAQNVRAVALLALNAGTVVPIADLARILCRIPGPDRYGKYPNVRSHLKLIRKAFKEVAPNFDEIECVTNIGYLLRNPMLPEESKGKNCGV